MQTLLFELVLAIALVLLPSCGSNHTTCTFTPGIAPSNGQADHAASPPKNQVQFSVVAPSTGDCPLIVGQVGSWSTSDPVNTTISNESPTEGLATCLNATPSPVTIANDGQVLGHSIASANLTCN